MAEKHTFGENETICISTLPPANWANWAKYQKNRIFFGYFAQNWVFFGHFFVKEGGDLAQSKIFLNRKILGVQIDRGGRGGLARSDNVQKKTVFFV